MNILLTLKYFEGKSIKQIPDYTREHQKDKMIKSQSRPANKMQQTCAQATALKASVAVSNDLIINQISQMT
jgi:hypothetical protein